MKNLPAMQEPLVQSLQKEMATHSSVLAWGIPWTEEPGGLQSMGSPRVRHDPATNINTSIRKEAMHSLRVKIMDSRARPPNLNFAT